MNTEYRVLDRAQVVLVDEAIRQLDSALGQGLVSIEGLNTPSQAPAEPRPASGNMASGSVSTEVVGDGGMLLNIPSRYTPETREIPTAEEIEPWITAIIDLWDNPNRYQAVSDRARSRAEHGAPKKLDRDSPSSLETSRHNPPRLWSFAEGATKRTSRDTKEH